MGDFEITVNANDRPIGSKHWRDMNHNDIYRVSALWLTDIKTGDVLIAQRKWDKKNDPGMWACAAAGTIEVDETYELNIVKETAEELGISGLDFTKGPKTFIDGANRFFCQWFLASVDKHTVTITIQEAEVEAVKWVKLDWLIADIASHPGNYVPSITTDLGALGVL